MPAKWKQWWYWGAVMVPISLGPGPNRGEVVAVQKRGAVVVAGVASQNDIGLFLIPSGKNIQTDLGGKEFVYGIAIQSDQKILVSGYSEKKGSKKIFVVRYLPQGVLDPSFGEKGVTLSEFDAPAEAHYMGLQKDGTILVAGFLGDWKTSRMLLLFYSRRGVLQKIVKTRFTRKERAYGLALQSDGKILLAGSVLNKKTGGDCAVVRFLPNGVLDKNFGREGLAQISAGAAQDACSSVAVQPDEKIIAGGFSMQKNSKSDFLIARLSKNGTLEESKTDGTPGFDILHALSPGRNGQIIAAGEASNHMVLLTYAAALSRPPIMKLFEKGSVEGMAATETGHLWLTGTLKDDVGLIHFSEPP